MISNCLINVKNPNLMVRILISGLSLSQSVQGGKRECRVLIFPGIHPRIVCHFYSGLWTLHWFPRLKQVEREWEKLGRVQFWDFFAGVSCFLPCLLIEMLIRSCKHKQLHQKLIDGKSNIKFKVYKEKFVKVVHV